MTLSSGGVAGTLAIGGNLTVTGNSTWFAQNTGERGATCKAACSRWPAAARQPYHTYAERDGRGHRGGRRHRHAQRQPELHEFHQQHVCSGTITGAGSTLTMKNNALASLTLTGTDTYGGQTTVEAGSLAGLMAC